jgi:hypothetical protein
LEDYANYESIFLFGIFGCISRQLKNKLPLKKSLNSCAKQRTVGAYLHQKIIKEDSIYFYGETSV